MTLVISIVISLILLAGTLIYFVPVVPPGQLGLCLPSPNEWALPPVAGWMMGVALVALSAAVLFSANKRNNFIPDAYGVAPSALLLLVGCNSLTTASLSSSTLLLAVNAICIYIIISNYEERNAARPFFIISSLISIGAMVQYAFIVMFPVYMVGGIVMKSFRLREFIAFLMGAAAPYWIAVGLGLVSPMAFHLPGRLEVVSTKNIPPDIFYTLLAMGAMTLIGLILSLYNGLKLYTRNSRLRCMHLTINVLGLVTIAAIIFDFDNFAAYFGTLALWVAIKIASLISFYHIKSQKTVLAITLALFLPIYILSML